MATGYVMLSGDLLVNQLKYNHKLPPLNISFTVSECVLGQRNVLQIVPRVREAEKTINGYVDSISGAHAGWTCQTTIIWPF